MEGISKTMGSGAGQVILPLALGAASVLAPKVAHGLASGMQLATHFGELNRKRNQSQSLRDLMTGGGVAGVDPALAGALPDESLPGFAAHAITQGQPQRWPMTLGDQQGIAEMPRTTGAKPSFTPMGTKEPVWGQAEKTRAFAMFKTTNPNPEQMGQVLESIKQEQLDKEQRGLQKSYDLQDRLNANAQARQDKTSANAQSRQEQAYGKAATERDITSARQEYKGLLQGYRQNMSKLDAEQQKQLKDINILPTDKRNTKKQEISQWYLENQGKIRDEYMAQYQDWQDSYSHIKQHLTGMGAYPRVIQRLQNKGAAPAGGDKPWMNMGME